MTPRPLLLALALALGACADPAPVDLGATNLTLLPVRAVDYRVGGETVARIEAVEAGASTVWQPGAVGEGPVEAVVELERGREVALPGVALGEGDSWLHVRVRPEAIEVETPGGREVVALDPIFGAPRPAPPPADSVAVAP